MVSQWQTWLTNHQLFLNGYFNGWWSTWQTTQPQLLTWVSSHQWIQNDASSCARERTRSVGPKRGYQRSKNLRPATPDDRIQALPCASFGPREPKGFGQTCSPCDDDGTEELGWQDTFVELEVTIYLSNFNHFACLHFFQISVYSVSSLSFCT